MFGAQVQKQFAQQVNDCIAAGYMTNVHVTGEEPWMLALQRAYESECAGESTPQSLRQVIVRQLGEMVDMTCKCDRVHGTYPVIAPDEDAQRTYRHLVTFAIDFSGPTKWSCLVFAQLVANVFGVETKSNNSDKFATIAHVAANIAVVVNHCKTLDEETRHAAEIGLAQIISATIEGSKELQTA